MRTRTTIAAMAWALLLAACGVAVPADKADYVGQWDAEGMSLLITRDGSIRYMRLRKGARTSIDGPLKGFAGNDFEVGIGPMTTTFKVSASPSGRPNWRCVRSRKSSARERRTPSSSSTGMACASRQAITRSRIAPVPGTASSRRR